MRQKPPRGSLAAAMKGRIFMLEVIKNMMPALIVGYILGSISFAVLFSKKLKGQDVRTLGSKNAGTTNMLRNFGWSAAGITFACDLLKGTAAVIIGRAIAGDGWVVYAGYAGALGALFGHMKPVFFGFRGGKGVATSLGAVLALNPLAFAILSLIGFPLAGFTGFVSLGSITCATGFPLLIALIGALQGRFDVWETLLALSLGGMIVFNHRANIRRLLNKTEQKFHPASKNKTRKEDGPNG
jgi:glycerol-3-phosphate acyltransferase PlsY